MLHYLRQALARQCGKPEAAQPMRSTLSIVLSCLLVSAPWPLRVPKAIQQDQNSQSVNQQASDVKGPKQALDFGLDDDTPVKLKLNRTISSADAHVNDTVDFDVIEQVTVKGEIVIPRGSLAWGTVTAAEPKKRMARGGKLDVNIDSVKLADGEKIPLRAVKGAKGGGHVGAMTGAMVATAIVFFPAAPLFLFMKGKDITIPQGTEITAYTEGDIPLNPSKFAPDPAVATPQPPVNGTQSVTAVDPAVSSVEIKSTPDGAEITIDGKFRGNTPSTLKLSAGEHTIRVEKPGFKVWEKTLTVDGGESSTVSAVLDAQSNP
jgi:hypothetical protein